MNSKTATVSIVYLLLAGILIGYVLMLGGWLKSNPVAAKELSQVAGSVKGVSLDDLSQEPIGGGSGDSIINKLKPYPKYLSQKDPSILAAQYTAYNPESGKVLYQSDDQEPVSIASTTKVMSSYLVMKYGNVDDVVEVSEEAAEKIGSVMGIYKGEKISVKNLLMGSLLVSGNDAIYALAEYVGGKLLQNDQASSDDKIARFVEEMNKTAESLNMLNTKYQDPCGLNDDGKSTALDLSKLMSVVMQNQFLQNIMQTATATVTDNSGRYKHELRNSNRFVTDYQYPGVIAGKTGYTPDAGHCLITAVKKDGYTVIVTILHTYSDTNEASAVEAKKLMDFTLQNVSFE